MVPRSTRSPVIAGEELFRQAEFKESMRRLLDTLPANRSKPRVPYSGNAFDSNMVIVLAVLLCALICVLGLNSILRCALRCGRGIAAETPEEAATRLAGTGLKKRALRQIPVAVYGPGVNLPATECPICLGEFAAGEKVRVLPKCNHGFHVRCIDTWLVSHSSCPTCRNSLLDSTEVDTVGWGAGTRSPRYGFSRPGGVVVVIDQAS